MCIFSSLMKSWLVVIGMWFSYMSVFGQYPAYFNYTIENGGPSNEIYSILQDKQGYIWIGCDAGLYRYNGVRFEQYTNPKLTARSVTGLCQAPSGTIYAYNFNGQILIVKNNYLEILKGWNKDVNHLSADTKGAIWVSSSKGIIQLNEKTRKWKFTADLNGDGKKDLQGFSNGIMAQKNGTLYYLFEDNLIERKNGKCFIHPINLQNPFFITESEKKPWVFGLVNGDCFVPQGTKYVRKSFPKLIRLLEGKKLTYVQEIGSDIWISTHSGIIRFSKKSGAASLYYPKIAFSACIKDTEGSYWFTTLHDGILRMPNLDYLSWNERTEAISNDQFSHVVHGKGSIFFATTDGELGEVREADEQLKVVNHSIRSDIGALYYDSIDNCLFFNKMNTVYRCCNGNVEVLNPFTRPVKDFFRLKDGYLLATSQGTYVYSFPKDGFKEQRCLLQDWSRQFIEAPFCKSIFVATNHGLKELANQSNQWKPKRTFLLNKQITAITKDSKSIFVLTFEGKIYQVTGNGNCKLITKLDENYHAVQLNYHRGKLFIATNHGLIVLRLKTGAKTIVNRYSGLNSNNISGCLIVNSSCWLSTGKGLHKLPLSSIHKNVQVGKIILRNLLINGKKVGKKPVYELNYSDDLKLQTDGLSFRSNGNFNFAYRFVGDRTGWILVPASVKEITIPRLPLGNVEMEVKLIDHENRNSSNRLRIKLVVKAPIWQRWWFYVLSAGLIIGISYLIFKRRIKQLRVRQELRLKQLQLENELRLTQQNALKAQMNPHFLFNVLNSIKGFIYENDKKNAAKYLGDFSSLVRKVLEMSALPSVPLADELETLTLYINLESMLLEEDFTFQFHVDDTIDTGGVLIPSLLLQPYVENAFKHGLRHKKGSKQLVIQVSEDSENQLLIIQIQDNGIGRTAAGEINRNQHAAHESFATNANEKRIELLNFERGEVIGVEIEDLISELGAATGTKVTIRIHI